MSRGSNWCGTRVLRPGAAHLALTWTLDVFHSHSGEALMIHWCEHLPRPWNLCLLYTLIANLLLGFRFVSIQKLTAQSKKIDGGAHEADEPKTYH